MFYLDLLEIGALTQKICYIPLYVIPQIDFSQIAVRLSGTWMNRISGVMGFFKNMLSQLAHIRNTQSTLLPKYTITPLAENLHSLVMDCTLKFKQDWITVLLFLTSTTKMILPHFELLHHCLICSYGELPSEQACEHLH